MAVSMASGPTARFDVRRWLLAALMLLIVLLVNLPIIAMILNSFKSTAEILAGGNLLPGSLSLANYEYLTQRTPFWTYFGNSITIALGGTALSILAAALAGYSLSRYRSAVATGYSRLLLLVQMFP